MLLCVNDLCSYLHLWVIFADFQDSIPVLYCNIGLNLCLNVVQLAIHLDCTLPGLKQYIGNSIGMQGDLQLCQHHKCTRRYSGAVKTTLQCITSFITEHNDETFKTLFLAFFPEWMSHSALCYTTPKEAIMATHPANQNIEIKQSTNIPPSHL